MAVVHPSNPLEPKSPEPAPAPPQIPGAPPGTTYGPAPELTEEKPAEPKPVPSTTEQHIPPKESSSKK